MLLFILFLSYAVPGNSLEKGKPVPHADELHQLLSKNLPGFSAMEPGSIIDYIINGNDPINPNLGLDTSVLDPTGIRKIVEKAWNDHRDEGLDEDAIMWDMFPADTPEHRQLIDKVKIDYRRRTRNHFGYLQLDVVANLALRQMKQSLYATKERIEATAEFRKRYSMLPSYQIALYTALVNLNLIRMESYWLSMETWIRKWISVPRKERHKKHIHFLWYLIYYEKALACNVDITETVKRIVAIHSKYMKDNPAVK